VFVPEAPDSGYHLPGCGDGALDRGEGCDDGNLIDDDGNLITWRSAMMVIAGTGVGSIAGRMRLGAAASSTARLAQGATTATTMTATAAAPTACSNNV
jgi:hypothetical protein